MAHENGENVKNYSQARIKLWITWPSLIERYTSNVEYIFDMLNSINIKVF